MSLVLHSRPWLTDEDIAAVAEVLATGMIGQGARTERFEASISEWLGVPMPGVGVGSGTAAIRLSLSALDVVPNDEIILPTYVCPSVLEAVRASGATPILSDVGTDWVITAENVASLLTPRTRAIIVPHMYGVYADVDSFRRFGVAIIEDCAQAVGAAGKHPLRGDIGILSFHPTKCLTTGEGGMALARDRQIAEKLRVIRDGDPRHDCARQFSPLSDLAATLGLSQLERYSTALARRREIAERYIQELEDHVPLILQEKSMFFRFPLKLVGGLDRYGARFRSRDIIVRRGGVNELLHRTVGLSDGDFPNAVALFDSTVSLPIYPAMTESEIDRCALAAREIIVQGDS